MRFNLFLSIILHVSVILLLVFGIPMPHKEIDPFYAMTVEMVNVSELSNLRNASKAKPVVKKQEEAKTLPKSAKKAQPQPDEPAAAQKETPKTADPKPEPVEPTPENAEKIPQKKAPPVKQKEVDKKKASKPSADKKQEKPKKQADDFAKSILKSLEQSSEAKTVEKKKIQKQEDEHKPDDIDAQTNREFNADAKLSLSEKDRVKSEIQKNWNTTAFSGSQDAAMRVTLIVKLDPLGNIVSLHPKHTFNSSASYQAFVSSVIRAVKLTNFSEFLRPENHSAWEELELNFDSSGMIY